MNLRPLAAMPRRNSGLTGALNILAYDASTETSATVKGRAFVNGITYYNVNGELLPVRAAVKDVEPFDPTIVNGVDIVDNVRVKRRSHFS